MKNKSVIKALSLALAAALGINSTVFAQDANLTKIVEQMQQQMSQMQQTINAQNTKIASLEGNSGGANIAAPVAMTEKDFKSTMDAAMGNVKTSDWLYGLKFNGDMRLRYETVHYSKGSINHPANDNRGRFRLRFGFEKKFTDEIKVGFRLASGTAGDAGDATSTNQTFGNQFSAKTIGIDRAYAIYNPNWAKVGPIKNLEIGGGKFQNPFERGSSDIIWDSDVVPEGAYETVDLGLIDQENFGLNAFATAGQLIVSDVSHVVNSGTAKSNSELWAFQGGFQPELKIGDMPVKATNALSFYDWSDVADDSNFIGGGSARNIPLDSATAASSHGFEVFDIYNALEFKPVDRLPWMKVYFDWARNTANRARIGKGENDDNAWALGYKVGKAKVKGDWEFGVAYKYIAPNATPSFNDSDFGYTNRKGLVFSTAYKLTDYLQVGVTAFLLNNLHLGSNLGTTAGVAGQIPDAEERRLFADMVWAF